MQFFSAIEALYLCVGFDAVCRPFGILILMLTALPFCIGCVMIAVGLWQDYRRNRRFFGW